MGNKKKSTAGMPFPIILEIPDPGTKGPSKDYELDINILIKAKLKAGSLYEMVDDLMRIKFKCDTGPRFSSVGKDPKKFIEAKPYRLSYRHEMISDQQYVFKVLPDKLSRVQVSWVDPEYYKRRKAYIMSHL